MADAPMCDHNYIIEKCKEHTVDGPDKFEFEDGGIVPNLVKFFNPSKSGSEKPAPTSIGIIQEVNKASNDRLRTKMEAMAILDGTKGLSEEFKFYFVTSLFDSFYQLSQFDKKNVDEKEGYKGSDIIDVVYPFSGSNINQISVEKFLKEFKEINESGFNQLVTLSKSFSELINQSVSISSQAEDNRPKLLKEIESLQSSRKNLAHELSKQVLKLVINELKRIYREKPSPELNAIIEKVSKINIQISSSDITECNGLNPNAFYNPTSNTVYLCENHLMSPNFGIIDTLFHEIAHSFDSCNLQNDTYKVDYDKLGTSLKKINPSNRQLLQFLDTNLTDEPKTLYLNLEVLLSSNNIKFLIENGVFTKVSSGIPPEKHPFKTALTCLSQSPFEFRRTDKSSLVDKARLIVKFWKTLNPEINEEKEIKQLTEKLLIYQDCDDNLSYAKPEIGETFSDLFSIKMLSKILKDKSKVQKSELSGQIISTMLSSLCFNIQSDLEDVKKLHGGQFEVRSAIDSLLPIVTNEHPLKIKRITDIYLQNNELRSALGCEPSKIGCDRFIPDGISEGKAKGRGKKQTDGVFD